MGEEGGTVVGKVGSRRASNGSGGRVDVHEGGAGVSKDSGTGISKGGSGSKSKARTRTKRVAPAETRAAGQAWVRAATTTAKGRVGWVENPTARKFSMQRTNNYFTLCNFEEFFFTYQDLEQLQSISIHKP